MLCNEEPLLHVQKVMEKNKHTEEFGILWFFLEAMNFSQEKRNRKKAKWFYAKPQ